MKIIVDTSSWLALVRYYIPFDPNSNVYQFFKKGIEDGSIILIDEVHKECSFVAKKIVPNTLSFFNDKKNITKTVELFPSPKFFNLVDNQFSIQLVKRRLTDVEYENQKEAFIKSADSKIILLGLKFIKEDKIEETIIVSEESSSANDHKLFKKIPAICSILKIKSLTLPELIEIFNNEINLKF